MGAAGSVVDQGLVPTDFYELGEAERTEVAAEFQVLLSSGKSAEEAILQMKSVSEQAAAAAAAASSSSTTPVAPPVPAPATCQMKRGIAVNSLPSTAKRCVSLSFILRFTKHFNLWHKKTFEVVKEIIVPMTSNAQVAWADLPPEESLCEEGEIKPPQLFLSHAWSNSWGLLVLALENYAKFNNADHKKLTCWIDIFVINQHCYMTELKQLDDVINICANFVQVIDTTTALPLRRVWCLYEVMVRLQDEQGESKGKTKETKETKVAAKSKHKKSKAITLVIGDLKFPTPTVTGTVRPCIISNISHFISHFISHSISLITDGATTTKIESESIPDLVMATEKECLKLFQNVQMEKSEATVSNHYLQRGAGMVHGMDKVYSESDV